MLRVLHPRLALQIVRRAHVVGFAGSNRLLAMTQHPLVLTPIRWKHHPSKALKTKQAAAKRFIRVGRGGRRLKFGSAGKAHLNVRQTCPLTHRPILNRMVTVEEITSADDATE